jgi:hypothetical protein
VFLMSYSARAHRPPCSSRKVSGLTPTAVFALATPKSPSDWDGRWLCSLLLVLCSHIFSATMLVLMHARLPLGCGIPHLAPKRTSCTSVLLVHQSPVSVQDSTPSISRLWQVVLGSLPPCGFRAHMHLWLCFLPCSSVHDDSMLL